MMHKLRYAIVLSGALFVASSTAQAQLRRTTTTSGQIPQAGMCRIWIDGVPADRQPAPTDCDTARRNAPPNSRVIYGSQSQGTVINGPRDSRDSRYDPRYDPRSPSYDPRLDPRDSRYDPRLDPRNRGRYDDRSNGTWDRRSDRDREKWERKRQKQWEKNRRDWEKNRGRHDGDDDDDRGRGRSGHGNRGRSD
jgi:hypothetical protein